MVEELIGMRKLKGKKKKENLEIDLVQRAPKRRRFPNFHIKGRRDRKRLCTFVPYLNHFRYFFFNFFLFKVLSFTVEVIVCS